ncbi:putative glycogen debranching enzyme [Dysgonomonas hofstadii]|uniref:Putative glycogen debranching enzyme n=1 Tax=Dysgonomonas hofstadii TaxID=637886 RepID=A0A840CI43_9BACT|nr:glycogen debranching enzyme N-terminal domain-containing protein [Dysgonomonas hofstadii]MBB4035687.1 putative glycogen debranching enzyme [Dysgonomonas hofstadii]
MDQNNAYLKFDKSRMVNLEYSLKREILRTNRRGAYHCTTLVECNTRKQHGLLVMPVPKLDNSNHVLLSSFDETVVQHGADFNLGIHKYDGNNYSPMGHKYIREFNCDSLPRTIYRVGGVVLSKEKMFSLEDNTIFIRYTLLDAHSPTIMRFKPFLAFREINELTSENSVAEHGYKEVENGISMQMYSGYPELFMQFSKEVNFVFEPNWYKGIEYERDKEEGLDYKEDLYVPGYFELPIAKGESIIFSASDVKADTSKLSLLFEDGIKERTPRSSFFNCLKNSGHQFYFRPTKEELYLLNGYPWGRVAAREQFMALPGLTFGLGKPESFEEVMDTAIPAIKNFMEGKPVSGFLQDITNADVLLWVLRSLKKYHIADHDRFYVKYAELVNDIVTFIHEGKHPYLKPLANGLLSVDNHSNLPSWMHSAAVPENIRSTRSGCLVEINAFWFNALMFNQEIALHKKNEKLAKKMGLLAEITKNSFLDIFLNDGGYLYDYVIGNYVDWSVRPNMLLAIACDYPLLDKRQSKSILDIITKELLTPKGIRSLSPKSIGFRPRSEGSVNDRLYSAYNGAAWPWLLGIYMEVYIKIFQKSGYSFLERLLIGIEEEMSNDGIGSLSAIYDGSIPYFGHGPISYATNVAGVLKALNLQNSFADEY